jgi:hypothetical protein
MLVSEIKKTKKKSFIVWYATSGIIVIRSVSKHLLETEFKSRGCGGIMPQISLSQAVLWKNKQKGILSQIPYFECRIAIAVVKISYFHLN